MLNGGYLNVLTDSDTAAELLLRKQGGSDEKVFSCTRRGTGSIRAVLFSVDVSRLGLLQREWEHHEDLVGLAAWTVTNWQLAWTASKSVLAKTSIDPKEIAGISTTCMREAYLATKTATRFGHALTLTSEVSMRLNSSLIWIQSLRRRFTRRVSNQLALYPVFLG